MGWTVRRVKEGTSAVLLQSGLDEKWWADSIECYTYLRIIQDLLSGGKTPYERRFGEPFKRPIIPFGSLVEYYPISAKDQSRIHQFGKKVLPGLFLGYALYAGGIWKGDIMVADIEEMETMDASEIYSKRLNPKEVLFPKRKYKVHFSSRRWTNKICWRRSGTENIHFNTGAPTSRKRSDRFSRRIRRVSTSVTSRLISGCPWSDKWLLVHVRKLHIPPSRWTQSQTLLAERRIISFSTEIQLTSPELLKRTWMLCKKAASMTVGISMDQEICLILGQVSLSSLYWKRNLQTDTCGLVRDWQESS